MERISKKQHTRLLTLLAAMSTLHQEMMSAHTPDRMNEVRYAIGMHMASVAQDVILPKAIQVKLLSIIRLAYQTMSTTGATRCRANNTRVLLNEAVGYLRECLERQLDRQREDTDLPDSQSFAVTDENNLGLVTIVEGDLLQQQVEVIVNSWNRNIIPWWLLIPQGVSGAIKRHGGCRPFIEVGRAGPIPLGGAVMTSAGRLPYRAIIHVAGIDLLWRASEASIRQSVHSAMSLVRDKGFRSVAFPIIGTGSGGLGETAAIEAMCRAFEDIDFSARVMIVHYPRSASLPLVR